MSTKIQPTLINTNPQTIGQYSIPRRFVRGLASHTMAPLILLEAFVTGGRTIQAYDRGGFEEARERFTEEAIGAAFWFGGVKGFNAMNDYFGKKILSLPTAAFDVGKDRVRNPLVNFIRKYPRFTDKTLGIFKCLKVGSSILLANALVGFVVPKINQHITAQIHEKRMEEMKENPRKYVFANSRVKLKNYIEKINTKDDEKDLTFEGSGVQTMLSLAHNFENNPTYQLLSTDVGIAGGRAISSRNNHERTEVLWRDLSSIYFYMFNMPNMNRWLNMIEQGGRKTRLNPVAAKQIHDVMMEYLKQNGGQMKPDDFAELIYGDSHKSHLISDSMSRKFKHGIINLDDFIETVKHDFPADAAKYEDLARRMSKLQPSVDGVNILTKMQVKDIFRGGVLNSPEFIDNIYNIETGGAHCDPFAYVNNKHLETLKEDVYHYAKHVVNEAKDAGVDITEKLLKKINYKNFAFNMFNWGTGFAISAIFLSTIIPKVQYWITKVTTGQNEFPGTADYSAEKLADAAKNKETSTAGHSKSAELIR